MTKAKERIEYYDIAKGILMILLLAGHFEITSSETGLDCDNFHKTIWYVAPFYTSFFMQAFFLISGFLSGFSSDFKTFLYKNIKALILPPFIVFALLKTFCCLTLNHSISLDDYMFILYFLQGSGPWFIVALFIDRLIMWKLTRTSLKTQIITVAIIYFFALLTWERLLPYNFQYYLHAMLMLPYLYIGYILKGKQELIDKWLFPLAMFGIVSIGTQTILKNTINFNIPTQDYYIHVTIKSFILLFVNVIGGTAFIIYIAKKLTGNKFLSVLGYGSLLVYIGNELIIEFFARLLSSLHSSENLTICMAWHAVVFVLILSASYLLIKLFYGSKYLKWTVGKW